MSFTQEQIDLANSVVRMIYNIAAKMKKKYDVVDRFDLFRDLFQVGYLAALNSARLHDKSIAKYTTYSHRAIRCAMNRLVIKYLDHSEVVSIDEFKDVYGEPTDAWTKEYSFNKKYADDPFFWEKYEWLDSFVRNELTEYQQELYDLYFIQSLSCIEIARIRKVRKQGVSESIRKIIRKIRKIKPDWVEGKPIMYFSRAKKRKQNV